jgi:hypothetical protein
MRKLGLALLALLALAGPAAAHRGHAVLTVVEIDRAAGSAVITHRMAAHDVEPALVSIARDAQPSLDDPEATAALTAYVLERFTVSGDARLGQTLRSFEAEGDGVTIVSQAPVSPGTLTLTVRSDLFGEVHPDMEHQVNVRVDGVTRTLIFRPSSGPQSLPLQPAD